VDWVYIVRHGATPWNEQRRFQGQQDVGLNTRGFEQARRLAQLGRPPGEIRIVASDLARAHQTALTLAEGWGTQVEAVDPRFRETNAGSWEGRTFEELGPELARWRTDPYLRPGGGETRVEVGARVVAGISDHMRPGRALIVVTHGGASRAAIGTQLRWDPHDWEQQEVLGNCHWTRLSLESGTWQLHEHNSSTSMSQ